MAGITVYQKPTCTTCRKVYAVLKESGADFDAVDYYMDPIPKAKLKELRKQGKGKARGKGNKAKKDAKDAQE